jgi:phenylalanyl-tRNA synthetase beta chain
MKVSLSWLQSYVEIQMDVEALANMLTMAGLEVDAVYDRYDFLSTVLVGQITSIGPHPKADKLKLCDVQAGEQCYRVVCGAPNAATGLRAPLALPGTELIDGTILSEGKIRGEISQGMLCSEVELGLGSDSSGLMELDNARKDGMPLNEALGLSDAVLEIDLTPNRPDCLSVLGIAREIAGYQGQTIKRPDLQLPQTEGDINDYTSVTIEAPSHCPRYTARLIEDLKVQPSPFWLQDRLLSVGLRPINNLVDITNFVMMETGQPLHAFDFDQLAEHRIVVRTAEPGEIFTTLDEKERTMNEETLMICDGEKAVGIGGVMGGMNSEIQEATTRVLLESAYFDPVSIRKTAKSLGLNTDAAHRFERGVDPHGTLFALNRAAALLASLGQGRLIGGTIDVQSDLPQPKVIDLKVDAANRLLGTDLDQKAMADLLTAIEFKVDYPDERSLTVHPPSFRVDVIRPEDLMEEIARCHGYNNIPTTFPSIPAVSREAHPLLHQRQRIREHLKGIGFTETINYSFIHCDSCDRLQMPEDDPRRRQVAILNPLTEDQSVLRTTLVPGLLETMGRNLARQSKTLKLFETGKVFVDQGKGKLPQETEILAGLWTGDRFAPGWHSNTVGCDFYDLKGVVESLLAELKTPEAQFTRLPPDQCIYTQPGATALIQIDDRRIGTIGQVRRAVLNAYDLKQIAFVFEIDVEQLIEFIPDIVQARPLPKYPSTARDATLIVDQGIEADHLLAQIRAMDQPLVEEARLFDVFQGEPIAQDRKSVSLRIIYRSATQTLEDDKVNQIHKKITDQLIQQFKADLPT